MKLSSCVKIAAILAFTKSVLSSEAIPDNEDGWLYRLGLRDPFWKSWKDYILAETSRLITGYPADQELFYLMANRVEPEPFYVEGVPADTFSGENPFQNGLQRIREMAIEHNVPDYEIEGFTELVEALPVEEDLDLGRIYEKKPSVPVAAPPSTEGPELPNTSSLSSTSSDYVTGPETTSNFLDFRRSDIYLKLIFQFCLDQLQLRSVSNFFKDSFDVTCSEFVVLTDSRLKSCVDTGIYEDITTRGLRIPLQIPFSILLRDFIGDDLKAAQIDLNSSFPLLPITSRKRAHNISGRNRRRNSERFLSFLRKFIYDHFNIPIAASPQGKVFSQTLYKFYKLLRVIFHGKDFVGEIIPLIEFPIFALLKYAALGVFEDEINYQLLNEFQQIVPFDFIFDTFESSNLGLTVLLLRSNNGDRFANIRDRFNRRPIHYAAQIGCIQILELLHALIGNKQFNGVDLSSEKAIHKAAACGHVAAVKWLYGKGSIVNAAGHCKSPIIKAIENDHIQVVEYLLTETNFDSSYNLSFSSNLVMLAISNNNLDMIRLLRNSLKLTFDQNHIQILLNYAERSLEMSDRIERILNFE